MAINLITHPARTMVVGKSGEGKTTVANIIIKNLLSQRYIQNVIVVCPSYDIQPSYKWLVDLKEHLKEKRKKNPKKSYLKIKFYRTINVSDLEKIEQIQKKDGVPCLMVLDDQTGEECINKMGKGAFSQLCNNAIWSNMSILFICHRIKCVDVALRDNLDNLLLFRLIRKDQRKQAYDEFLSDIDQNVFQNLYDNLEHHNFIFRHLNGDMNKYLFIGWNKQVKVKDGSKSNEQNC